MELAMLEGREAVFLDGEEPASDFAAEVRPQPFREQIDFLRQKRPLPTNVWTDAMQGVHDRAFVVAGVTDIGMLEEFQAAIINAASGGGIRSFEKDFDRLVEKYGWAYRGERNWRIRTIFTTNIRTSYMAGQLKQMRDPDVVRLRPYWQYLHGESRTPLNPRPLHLSWHGLVLMHDDPWWDIHFPPNDWLCSCGVRTLSRGDLRRMGKSGPDVAPKDALLPVIDKATKQVVMRPRGVGAGWDYQPGNLWEKGLVPSALIDEAGGISAGRQKVVIDLPDPVDELFDRAQPFSKEALGESERLKSLGDADPEEYVRSFLKSFNAEIGKAVLFEDKAGMFIPVSDQLFRERGGQWKIKRDRGPFAPLMAEAILDPDEIWIGVVEKPLKRGDRDGPSELILDRRYIRVDRDTGLIVVYEIGRKWWDAITAYPPADKSGKSSRRLLDLRRGGKLLWKRK